MKKRITALALIIVMVLSVFMIIPQPVSAATTKVTTTAVYLRSKATTKSGKILVVVPENSEVSVISTSKNWSKVTYTKSSKTYKGYIYSKYLKTKSSTTTTTTTKVLAEDLYMRSSKSTASASNIIYVLKKGSKVTILATYSNYWAKVKYSYTQSGKTVTKTGYIRTGHFTDDKSRMGNYKEKTRTALNLRSTTSTSSKANIICVIPKGKTITVVIYIGNNWYKVKYGNYTGYVKGSYFE